MIKIKFALLIILLVTLSACGFRLAGKAELDPVFENTHVGYQSGGREVAALLERQFRANDINPVAAQAADVIVNILYERRDREILAVDAQGKVREFELIMRVGVDAKSATGETYLANQDIRLTRSILFDINDVLGSQREQEAIYQEMREDISRLIIYRLQTVSSVPTSEDS